MRKDGKDGKGGTHFWTPWAAKPYSLDPKPRTLDAKTQSLPPKPRTLALQDPFFVIVACFSGFCLQKLRKICEKNRKRNRYLQGDAVSIEFHVAFDIEFDVEFDVN